jgi:hypothetical protein
MEGLVTDDSAGVGGFRLCLGLLLILFIGGGMLSASGKTSQQRAHYFAIETAE